MAFIWEYISCFNFIQNLYITQKREWLKRIFYKIYSRLCTFSVTLMTSGFYDLRRRIVVQGQQYVIFISLDPAPIWGPKLQDMQQHIYSALHSWHQGVANFKNIWCVMYSTPTPYKINIESSNKILFSCY